MESLNEAIENHYLKEGLFEDIINRLEEQDVDLDKVQRSHISGVDEFHVRGAAVSKELANSIDMKGLHVLDVGCGLGGPCRMLADEYDCTSTGIDLSNEYIKTAAKLSKLVNLDSKTTFTQGDAVKLPFEDDAFDVVWTQHVQMNIPDKNKFYSEIKRVLKKNGHLLYYDIFKKGDSKVSYPMPWASKSNQSFLFDLENKNQILNNLGFSKIETKNQTQKGIDFFEALVVKLKEVGPPKMGLNVLMGETTKQKLVNLMNHLKDEKLVLESGTYKY